MMNRTAGATATMADGLETVDFICGGINNRKSMFIAEGNSELRSTVMGNQALDWEVGWREIRKALKKLKRIMGGDHELFTSEEYMNLYTVIYDMCTQHPLNNYPFLVYDGYKRLICDYICAIVIPSLRGKSDEFLLREFAMRWKDHKLMVRWLVRFFSYLERSSFVRRKGLQPLLVAGLSCFQDLVHKEFKCRVTDAVIALINQEREEKLIDKALLKDIVDIYVEMDCYENGFENVMLTDVVDYYSRKSSQWVVEDSCSTYMIKVEECLKKEKARSSQCLHWSSENKVSELVLHHLLVQHFEELLVKENWGCHVLLRDDKVEDLSRMYKLFDKLPEGVVHLVNYFKKYVSDECMILIKQADDVMRNKAAKTGGAPAVELMAKIIELHDKCMLHVTDSFFNGSLFHRALREAFESFCRKTVGGSTTAENLAALCDDILRKAAAGKLSSEAAEGSLDKAVSLLIYVSDKDLFSEFYSKKLSRRLLFDRNAQDDQEMFALSKMKQQCGAQFTSKMQKMITDISLAKEIHEQFQQYTRDNGVNLGMDLSVTVITTGIWPSYKSSDLNLPAEMAKCVKIFKDFYGTKTSDRKLTFIYSLGSCNVIGKFQHKHIELVVTTYQAAVLLLFNDEDKLSYAEIKEQLQLGDDDLFRLLHSLSCAKYNILNKLPKSKSISPDDNFEFNSKFTDRLRKIKVPLPPADERRKVIEHVEKDRRYSIDAALVRIMKSRKVLGYQALIAECVQQMSKMFKPEVKVIKRRIEDLIARDYVERDEVNPNTFKYIA